jgi:hypothetical protein
MTGNSVKLTGSARRNLHTARMESDGTLVCEWYEWQGEGNWTGDRWEADPDDPPYDHADMIIFDDEAQRHFARLLDVSDGDGFGERLLAAIQKRFQNWFEVQAFARENAISFKKEVDFMP